MNIVKNMEAIFVIAAVALCSLSYPGSQNETAVASYTVAAISQPAVAAA